MADSSYSFRSALSGFHKGDVTGYIERTATQHRSELLERDQIINALQEENRSLQQQLNLLMMATPISAPESMPEPAPVTAPAPVPVPVPASVPVSDAPTEQMQKELEAYRRAEAAERTANIRARQLYASIADLCSGALGDFQAADAAVKQAIDAMIAQASSLELAYQALSAALNVSREKVESINDQFPAE